MNPIVAKVGSSYVKTSLSPALSLLEVRLLYKEGVPSSATLNVVKKEGNVVRDFAAQEIIELAAEVQQNCLDGNFPTASFLIDDGRMQLKVDDAIILSAGPYAEAKGSSTTSLNLTSGDVFLQSIDLSIYREQLNYYGAEDLQRAEEATLQEGESLPAYIKRTVQRLTSEPDPPAEEKVRQVFMAQHELNLKYLPLLEKVLDNSEVDIIDLITEDAATRNSITDLTFKTLLKETNSFWENLSLLFTQFYAFYQPSVDFSAGRFLQETGRLTDPQDSLTIDMEQVIIKTGVNAAVPVTQGLMKITGQTAYYGSEDAVNEVDDQTFIAFPDTAVVSVGFVPVPVPTWLPREIPLDINGSLESSDDLDYPTWESAFKDAEKTRVTDPEPGPIEKTLRRIVKEAYVGQVLKSSNAQLTGWAVNGLVTPGYRIQIKGRNGLRLASGAVSSSTYDIRIGSDVLTIDASATLNYVLMEGVSVPGM